MTAEKLKKLILQEFRVTPITTKENYTLDEYQEFRVSASEISGIRIGG